MSEDWAGLCERLRIGGEQRLVMNVRERVVATESGHLGALRVEQRCECIEMRDGIVVELFRRMWPDALEYWNRRWSAWSIPPEGRSQRDFTPLQSCGCGRLIVRGRRKWCDRCERERVALAPIRVGCGNWWVTRFRDKIDQETRDRFLQREKAYREVRQLIHLLEWEIKLEEARKHDR